MEYVVASLFAIAIILLLVSFFLRDTNQDIREELDQLTIQQVQELYQIKKKLRVLEEELLITNDSLPRDYPKNDIHEIIKNQVWSLVQQGKSVDQIAIQSSLTVEEVDSIIQEFSKRGIV